MSPCRLVFSAVLAGTLLLPAFSQNPPIISPPTRGPGSRSAQTTPPNRQRQEPCWQVAGITKTAIEQRRALAEQAKQQIEAVCANSSLTLAQKREEIRSIHEREKQQAEALITPQQQEALKACQESRGHGGHGGGFGGGGHGMGPCGEMPSAPPGKTPTRPEPNSQD